LNDLNLYPECTGDETFRKTCWWLCNFLADLAQLKEITTCSSIFPTKLFTQLKRNLIISSVSLL